MMLGVFWVDCALVCNRVDLCLDDIITSLLLTSGWSSQHVFNRIFRTQTQCLVRWLQDFIFALTYSFWIIRAILGLQWLVLDVKGTVYCCVLKLKLIWDRSVTVLCCVWNIRICLVFLFVMHLVLQTEAIVHGILSKLLTLHNEEGLQYWVTIMAEWFIQNTSWTEEEKPISPSGHVTWTWKDFIY